MINKFFIISLIVAFSIIHSLGWSAPFATPKSLENQVDLWTKVYSYWDNHQVVFFDEYNPQVVYFVQDLPKVENQISSQIYKKEVQAKKKEIINILDALAEGKKLGNESALIKQILEVLKQFDLSKEKDLSKRLRTQNGLKGQFAWGLKTSGRYAEEIKALLRASQLPEELMALVFVESLFYLSATSHAGASGLWGIIKETALRSGIQVNSFVDERLDPVLSTKAAAEFLKKAKEGLTEWPLAISAYNYGYAGMLRASNNLNSKDIEVIIANHESPIFGYASKNYYAEFLAAMHVYENRAKIFPEVKMESPWSYELVQVLRPVLVSDLEAFKAISKEELKSLNPSLSKRTMQGLESIPPMFSLRVPKGQGDHFYAQLKKVPEKNRRHAESLVSRRYHANGRKNLLAIAKEHGISVDFLAKKLNKTQSYKPKGTVFIRSAGALFSQLGEIKEKLLVTRPSLDTNNEIPPSN